jgi:hypothetical protein
MVLIIFEKNQICQIVIFSFWQFLIFSFFLVNRSFGTLGHAWVIFIILECGFWVVLGEWTFGWGHLGETASMGGGGEHLG